MTQTKHTPGPWKLEGNPRFDEETGCYAGGYGIVGELEIICELCERLAPLEAEANARLIAAAPELLETLERLTYEAERRAGVPKHFIAQARAAIAKAEGK